ncbi:hypothetical protein Clacol_010031 [Clathrus columnatus]|uniref:Uncharacterized protein n=1 Tax=Clathrus columnatus TaxID=1419009 RepID=A0AAV5AQI1_9AGAM|nr:hypothetical protein Clacol_010031 [Clathrus columnatus]
MSSQFLLISNSDSDVDYSGNWTIANSSQLSPGGSLGPPFEPQLHNLALGNGSFSFFFHGSSINVIGSIPITNSNSNSRDPTWECFIDGISLGPPTYPNVTENNWSLCEHALSDGPHQLEVIVNSTTSPFYFDYLLYAPSVGISLENNTIFISGLDPDVTYDSTWSVVRTSSATSEPGGEVIITFVGQSLDYYGSFLFDSPHNSSSAQYSVDGQPFVTFALDNNLDPNARQDLSNQKFFSTGLLDQGSHGVIVKNMGNSSVTPLTFGFGIIAFDTSPSSSGGPATPSNHSSPPPATGSIGHHSKSNTPAIIGGAVAGAIAFVVFLIAVVLFWRRRQRRRSDSESSEMQLQRATRISPLSISHPTQPSYQSVMTAPSASTSIPSPDSKVGLNAGPRTQSLLSSSSSRSRSGSTLTGANSISKTGVPVYVQEPTHHPPPSSHARPVPQARMSISPLNSGNPSATPLLEDWEAESEAPPTYTSRPDIISAEKLRRYFKREKRQ